MHIPKFRNGCFFIDTLEICLGFVYKVEAQNRRLADDL